MAPSFYEKRLMEDVYIALAVADGVKNGNDVVDDPIRSTLVRETIQIHAANERKMCVVYSEGYPPAPDTWRLMKYLEERGILKLREQRQTGIGGAQRESICIPFREYGARIVVHQEPEKVDFARNWIYDVVKPIIEKKCQSVVPRRSPKSWASYYEFQIRTESRTNDVIALIRQRIHPHLDGIYLDEIVGPTSFGRGSEPRVWEYQGTLWDAHMAPHDNILANGGKVGSIEIDYMHPTTQIEAERNDQKFLQKRITQMIHCINAVLQHNFNLYPNKFERRPTELKTLKDMELQFPTYDWNIFYMKTQ